LSAIGLNPQINNRTVERELLLGGPRISVIVPVRNGSKHLPRCLEALSHSEYVQFEVIVVDDCSTDITPQIAERYGARCVRTPRTVGPGGARNLGAQHAGGEILLFVDSDVVMPPGALCLIAEDFRRDPELAAVFGSYDDTPPWTSFISQYKNLMHHYVHQASSESAATFWAGCGAVRKTVFEEFGGFDAATYAVPSIEDIALGLEMARAGRKIQLDKRLAVKHLKRWTFRNLLRADILHHVNDRLPVLRAIARAEHATEFVASSAHVLHDFPASALRQVGLAVCGKANAGQNRDEQGTKVAG